MLLTPVFLLLLLSLFAVRRWPSWFLLLVLATLGAVPIAFSAMMLGADIVGSIEFTSIPIAIYLLLGSCVIWLARTRRARRRTE